MSDLFHEVILLAAWLALLVAIFVPLERLCALHPKKIWRKQIGVDLAWYFINSLLPAWVLSVPLVLLARILHELNPGGFYTAMAALPLWVRIILTLVVTDIGAYWGHRAMHAFPALWRFHAVHHSAEELDWLVNTRAHPVDEVFIRLAGFVPVYLLGLAQVTGGKVDAVVFAASVFGTIWTFFIHANVRVRLGPLEWIICTPVFHHWHHTKDEHRDRNFAFVFPFIDRLFGTAWLPRHWPRAYGISGRMAENLADQFFDPFVPPPQRAQAAAAVSSEKQKEASTNQPTAPGQ